MRAILDILWRDVRARLRDRSAIVLGLIAPFALIAVFSLISGGPTTEDRAIGYTATGESVALQRAVRQGALAQLEDDGTIRVTDYPDAAAVRRAIDDGDVEAGLVVDGGTLRVLGDPNATVATAIVDAVARGTAATIDGVARGVAAQRALGVAEPDQAGLALELFAAEPPVAVRDASELAGGLDNATQIAAGMATFFLFFTVQFGIIGLLQERRQGTLARLLVAPVAPWQVVVAKLAVSFVLGILSMTALVVSSSLLLGTDWGNPVAVGLLIVCGVMAATATVALVAGFTNSPDQAAMAQSMVAIVLGILGGAFFSMVRSGGAAAVVTKFTPHYWFGEGLVRLTGGGSWTVVLLPCLMMVAFALAVGLPGLILARRTARL